jgi:chemotaxis protein CheY-P-specific phosphatase CheC
MLALITPILMKFVTSRQVKQMIVDLLTALAAKSENKLDDLAVEAVKEALLPEE